MRHWLLIFWAVVSYAHAGDAERVFESVRNSVVTIATFDERNQPDGEGSGVVIASGQVVTNCHVVQEATKIQVRSGSKQLTATLSLSDVDRDLCQLAVPELTLPAVKIRDNQDIQTGEQVFAVGNPLGFGLAVSSGLVSAIQQQQNESVIITSTPVSPGSSGGGLFDMQGRLVGITTLGSVRGAQNMNMAVPSSWVTEIPKRGKPARKAETSVPDPDWMGQAETLRLAAEWGKLADWARRWSEIYPTSFDAQVFLGLAFYNLKKFEDAKQTLLKASQQEPSRAAVALSYLAGVYQATGEKEAAMKALLQLTELQPSNGFFWRLLAAIQRENGANTEALASVQKSLRYTPGDEYAWEFLGELSFQQKKYQDAVDAFQTVLRLKPDFAGVANNLALAQAALGENSAARQTLASKAAASSLDAGTWLMLGDGEERKGRFAEAERAYRKALEIQPELAEALLGLARVLMRSNRVADAETALRQALKFKPGLTPAWGTLGDLLNGRGDKVGAKEAFEKVVALEPVSAKGWFSLGVVLHDMRDFVGATKALEHAIKYEPSQAEAWALLGESQIRMGRVADAFKPLQEAERLDSKNELMLQALATYYGLRSDPKKSLSYSERALEINSASPNTWSNKGYALLKLQRFTEAVMAFETAIRLQPDFVNAWVNLGEAYFRSKQMGKAISALEKALSMAPDSMDARLYLAQALIASMQFAKAKEHLNTLLHQNSNNALAWGFLAAANMSMGDKQGALVAYNRLKSLSPELARSLRVQSRAQGMPVGYELPE